MLDELNTRGRGTALEDERCGSRPATTGDIHERAGSPAQEGTMQQLTTKPAERGPIGSFAARVLRGEVPPPPIARTLGFVLVALEPGRSVVEYTVDLER